MTAPTTTYIDPALGLLVDELIARQQAGESVDWSAAGREHPEFAEALAALRPALVGLGRLSGAGDSAVSGLGAADADGPISGILGDFRLIREVGRGGMGVVYEAEQISLNRRVALKVLPFAAVMDARALQRFRHEAQAAAMLHHPHIVPVYGVGCERGVHYYAMQLIEGRSLAAVIDEMRPVSRERERPESAQPPVADAPGSPTAPVAALSTRKTGPDKAHYRRVAELVAQAADALEFAHSMGVVHRDVKPANLILDEDGHLWVTDFGLAKLDTAAGLTISGDLLGTLRYMSPEQALAKHGLVDHRTDVYSLGATLYELLTLRPAVDGEDKQEVLRRIAFEEPVALRKIDKAIPTDLETVTLKALAKNPTERYATAGEFADDLRSWLGDQSIQAKRPSLSQRVRRWGRRNRPVVMTAAGMLAVLAVTLVGATAVSVWYAVETGHARDRAKDAEAEAQDEADIAQAVSDFFQNDLLAEAAPDKNPRNKKVTVEELLGRAAARIDGKFDQQPRLEAAVREAIGVTYTKLGNYTAAQPHLERALEIRRRVFGEDHRKTLGSMTNLANNYRSLGRPADAVTLNEAALALSKIKLGPDDLDMLRIMVNLAGDYGSAGRHADALTLNESALSVLKVKAPDHATTLQCMNNLAGDYATLGRVADALTLNESTAALMKAKHGPDHPDTLTNLLNLGIRYHALGRYADALTIHEKTLALMKAKLGPDHPETLACMANLASNYAALGRKGDALKLDEQTLALRKATLGPDHPDTLASSADLAVSYYELGRFTDALKLNEETLALLKAKFGADHPRTLNCMLNQGNNYHDLGRTDDALEIRERTLALMTVKLGSNHPNTLMSMENLAGSYAALGRWTDALKLNEESLTHWTTALGPHHPNTLKSACNLAWKLADCPDTNVRNPGRAVVLAKNAVARVPDEGDFWKTLGAAHYRARDWQAAATALTTAMRLRNGGDSIEWFFLAMTHGQLGQKAEARKWYDRAVEWMDKNKPQEAELRRYRAEAAALLGIPDPAESKKD